MSIFQRSKAEDSVDRYNHIWSVLFLLLLSLITWLIPLSPFLSIETSQPSNSQQNTPVPKPRYTANCWCPSHFTGSQIMYVNSICAGVINKKIDEMDNPSTSSDSSGGAVLYELKMDEVIPADVTDRKIFMSVTKLVNESVDTGKTEDMGEDKASRFRHFISLQTPLILFIFAICLKLPHVVWTLLSGCVGINISQTLETAKEGQSLDKDSRHQLKQDLVHAVSQSAKSTSYSTAVMYLLFKVLMCIVVVAELVYVHGILVAEKETFENKMTVLSSKVEDLEENFITMAKAENIPSGPLLCDVAIRQASNVARYTLQCVFTATETPSSSTEKDLLPVPSNDLPHVYMYKALFTALMIYLMILFIINVINLFIWIFKLVLGPCRQRVTPNNNLPLDVYLLLYMAQDNVGHLVARDLSDNFVWANRKVPLDEQEEKM